jgi:hypothetical protein
MQGVGLRQLCGGAVQPASQSWGCSRGCSQSSVAIDLSLGARVMLTATRQLILRCFGGSDAVSPLNCSAALPSKLLLSVTRSHKPPGPQPWRKCRPPEELPKRAPTQHQICITNQVAPIGCALEPHLTHFHL